MNKLLLSIVGLAAFTAFAPSAEARDRCYRPSSEYRYSHGYYQPTARVYYAQPTYYSRPTYTRTYHRSYDTGYCAQPVRRVEYRSYDDDCRHHGLRGFIHRIFR